MTPTLAAEDNLQVCRPDVHNEFHGLKSRRCSQSARPKHRDAGVGAPRLNLGGDTDIQPIATNNEINSCVFE